MSKVQLQGNVSGTGIFTIASPNSNTDRTLTLPDNTGTLLSSASTLSPSQLGSQFSINSGAPSNSFVMDAGGRITTPNQPAFAASGGAGNVVVNFPTALALQSAQFNRGNHYNTATSKFTAPIAGVYQFNITAYVNSDSGTIVFLVNDAQIGGADCDNLQFKTTTSPYTMAMSICVSLAANDNVSVSTRDGFTTTFYTGHTTFSGFLVG